MRRRVRSSRLDLSDGRTEYRENAPRNLGHVPCRLALSGAFLCHDICVGWSYDSTSTSTVVRRRSKRIRSRIVSNGSRCRALSSVVTLYKNYYRRPGCSDSSLFNRLRRGGCGCPSPVRNPVLATTVVLTSQRLRVSYKAAKPGLVCIVHLSMFYVVLLFFRPAFYISLVFVGIRSIFWLFWLIYQYLPSDWLERLLWGSLIVARGSSPESPGRRVRMIFLAYCIVSLFCDVYVLFPALI